MSHKVSGTILQLSRAHETSRTQGFWASFAMLRRDMASRGQGGPSIPLSRLTQSNNPFIREVKAPKGSCIREGQRAATDLLVVGAAVGLRTP